MRLKKLQISFEGTNTNILTTIIASICMFVAFFSFYKSSIGIECLVVSVIIIALNIKRSNIINYFPYLLFCAVTIFLLLISGQFDVRGFNSPINHTMKFVYLLLTVALVIGIKELPKSNKRKVLKWTLVSIIISTITSLYYVFFVDKYAIRYQDMKGFDNVIDFSQFYGICLISCVLVFLVLNYRKQFSLWIQLIVLVIMFVCIGVSLYVTGVLLCLMGIALSYAIYKFDQSKSKAMIGVITLIGLLFVVFLFGNQISDWIYDVTEPLNWILKDRIRSVADTVFRTDHNILYSYDRRDELAEYSLTTFRENMVFGIGYKTYGYGIIGCHQEWQDMLGVFGIVGTSIFALLMFHLFNYVKRNIDNIIDLHSFYIAMILFLILGFLNPCLNLPVLFAVFVIAPNISLLVPCWKNE